MKIVVDKSDKSDKSDKPNKIAENFNYGTEGTYHEQILLTKLSNALKPNQWIHITKTPNLSINNFKNIKNLSSKNAEYFKPYGLWMSKGEWLFHDFSGLIYKPNSSNNTNNKDNRYYVYIISVDYDKIYNITSKNMDYSIDNRYITKFNEFRKKYVSSINIPIPIAKSFKFLKPLKPATTNIKLTKKQKSVKSAKSVKSTKLQRSQKLFMKTYVINWSKIYNKYSGFAFFPYYSDRRDGWSSDFPDSYDVSSAVIWNKKAIKNIRNIGDISLMGDNADNRINNIVSKILSL
jgi:hypothetical protein